MERSLFNFTDDSRLGVLFGPPCIIFLLVMVACTTAYCLCQALGLGGNMSLKTSIIACRQLARVRSIATGLYCFSAIVELGGGATWGAIVGAIAGILVLMAAGWAA